MAYTREICNATWNGGDGITRTVTEGEGITLFTGQKDYRVMSDIWEYGTYAIIWNEAENRIQTVDWVKSAIVDATPAIIEKAKAAIYASTYKTAFDRLKAEAENTANMLVRGCMAQIYKGRKFPKGTEGKVIGFSDSQWGRNVGIATSDEMIEVVKNGRTFKNHKDVIWVAIGNVKRIDVPAIDLAEITSRATSKAEDQIAKMNWFAYY